MRPAPLAVVLPALALALLLPSAAGAVSVSTAPPSLMEPTPGGAPESTGLYNDSQDAQPALSPGGIHPNGWFAAGSSLLFYDEKGDLSNEIPLVHDEQPDGRRVDVHDVTGGSSPNARFGWTFETTKEWNQERTKIYSSRRLLRVYGSDGKELWSTSQADAADGNPPVVFSADGTVLLVSNHDDEGWTVQAKGWAGNTIMEVGPVPHLQLMTLTRNGRYGLIRWLVPDKSATHTFIEIPTKTRQDVPSDQLYLGLARITEDGKVYSGKKFVFDFAAVPKKGQIPGLPPKETPPPNPPAP